MKKITITEAAIETLKRNGKPLLAEDMYTSIVQQGLYKFNAKNPESILKSAIRKHCQGIENKGSRPTKYFQILNDGTYWLKDTPVPR